MDYMLGIGYIGWFIVCVFLLYMAARLVFYSWFQSKIDYLKRLKKEDENGKR